MRVRVRVQVLVVQVHVLVAWVQVQVVRVRVQVVQARVVRVKVAGAAGAGAAVAGGAFGKCGCAGVGATPISIRQMLRKLEAALAALGLEDSAAKAGVESALRRAKQGTPVARVDPDTRVAAARKRVSRLERALAVERVFEGSEVVESVTASSEGRAGGPWRQGGLHREGTKEDSQDHETGLPKCGVGRREEVERSQAFRHSWVDPTSTPLPELEQLQVRVAQLHLKLKTPVFFEEASRRGQEQSRTVDPSCGKNLFHHATKMSSGGCEIANWTCQMRQQQGMPTNWRGCAKLWLPQRRSCHRYRRLQWSQTAVKGH